MKADRAFVVPSTARESLRDLYAWDPEGNPVSRALRFATGLNWSVESEKARWRNESGCWCIFTLDAVIEKYLRWWLSLKGDRDFSIWSPTLQIDICWKTRRLFGKLVFDELPGEWHVEYRRVSNRGAEEFTFFAYSEKEAREFVERFFSDSAFFKRNPDYTPIFDWKDRKCVVGVRYRYPYGSSPTFGTVVLSAIP